MGCGASSQQQNGAPEMLGFPLPYKMNTSPAVSSPERETCCEPAVCDVESQRRLLTAAAVRAATAAKLNPCVKCKRTFSLTWTAGESIRCYSCATPIAHEDRIHIERESRDLVLQLDLLQAPTAEQRERNQVERGIRVGYLKSFASREDCIGLTTAQVVEQVVKPATQHLRCRWVEREEVVHAVSRATVYVSHAWGAAFADLVAGITSVLDNDAVVWLDIFSVRQWPGNEGDLGFECVIRDTNALVLCVSHQASVADLPLERVLSGSASVPEDAQKACAFFRVWCLAEVFSALHTSKPVVTLVGRCDITGAFKPNSRMMANLPHMVDMQKAAVSFPGDRERILADIKATVGYKAANTITRAAAFSADIGSSSIEVMRAACGNMRSLSQLCDGNPEMTPARDTKLVGALMAAAAGGFCAPMRTLLEAGVLVGATQFIQGPSALAVAAQRGQLAAVHALLGAGAHVNASNQEGGYAPLHEAAMTGHTAVVKALIKAGAEVDQMGKGRGRSALMLAAVRGHFEVVQVLIEAHATVDLVHSDGRTPLMYAAQAGCAEVVEALLAKGADPDRVGGRTNATALIYSVPGDHLEVVKVLVAAGAKVGVRDNTGKNALAYIKVDSSTQISNLLIEASQLQGLPSGDSDR